MCVCVCVFTIVHEVWYVDANGCGYMWDWKIGKKCEKTTHLIYHH